MTEASQESRQMEIDGELPSAQQMREAVLFSYGHFTAMQVRNRRTRGLDLHIARLDAAHRELFGAGIEPALVRDRIGHALGDDSPDASVRVYVRESRDEPSLIVTVRPPGGIHAAPWRLKSVPYQRAVAHIKHIGDFGQTYYRLMAQDDGYDEALLTGPDGSVAEGSTTNIGFFDGTGIVWPDAPALAGITMQLVERNLAAFGLTSRRAPVRMSDLQSFRAAFVTNARGVAPVGRIDDFAVPVDLDVITAVRAAYESADWDLI